MPGTWDNIDLTVFIPFWNRDLRPPQVDYTVIQAGCWLDPNTKWSNIMWTIGEFQWLNKCNPDWLNLINDTPVHMGVLHGEGFYQLDDIASISIVIDDTRAQIDKWWGSTQIGKYGVVSPAVDDFIVQPLTFVNCLKNLVHIGDENYTGLYYNFQPGVYADITAGQYGHHIFGSSKTPPIYWYCPLADILPLYNLDGGHHPYSVYGPERVP